MTWRAIVVNSKFYTWKCGNTFLVIRDSEGKRFGKLITIGSLFGITWDTLETARKKGSDLYTVTPIMISDYIKIVEEERAFELKKRASDHKRRPGKKAKC